MGSVHQLSSTEHHDERHEEEKEDYSINGYVKFNQLDKDDLEVIVHLTGLRPNQHHALHVHQYADLSEGCSSFGGHYNPLDMPHGAPNVTEKYHMGDLGNIVADENGNVMHHITSQDLKLYGKNSILGRGCMIHEGKDDLGKGEEDGSHTHGNAGSRMGCGAIGLKSE